MLEGEESSVEETYARICCDPRHKDLNLLSKTRIDHRDFSAWHMGFRQIAQDSLKDYLGDTKLFPDNLDLKHVHARDGVALDLLKWFAAN